MEMKVDWNRFGEILHESENVVLTSHIRPDCDALGSCLGMAGILRRLGKSVRIVCGQKTPPNLRFIDPDHQILEIGSDISADQLADADLQMVLDTSAWVQLGSMAEVIRGLSCKKIILDHHVGQDEMGAELFKDTTAEATGRLVVEAADHLGVALTAVEAMPLFAALATDTGWFRFPAVTALTYRTAARLIEAGAVPSELYGYLYERETVVRVRLRGVVMSRIEVEFDGRLAHTFIKPEDYELTGALPSDTEDLVNLALAIEGTCFAVILVGQLDGGYKISFRSRCGVACNEVASKFGGGGHKAAAGAFVEGSLEQVSQAVLEHVRKCLQAEFATRK